MIDRAFAPPSQVIPHKAIRAALEQYEQAQEALRDARRELDRLDRAAGEAAARDVAETAAALAASKPDPGPVHRREYEQQVDAAMRVHAAREQLANTAWSVVVSRWGEHEGELTDHIAKSEARERRAYEETITRLEEIRQRLATNAALRTVIGADAARWRPGASFLLTLPPAPIQDGDVVLLEDVIESLRWLGRRRPQPPSNPAQERADGGQTPPVQRQHMPLYAQGVAHQFAPGA